MLTIGCDYHPGFQQIAFVETDMGEEEERHLVHREQAEQFCRELKQRNVGVRVEMESSGHSRWSRRIFLAPLIRGPGLQSQCSPGLTDL